MEFTDVAGTGVRCSRIGLGTWAIGGWMWGGVEEQEATRAIHAAIDHGITLIDTAPVYGFGRSEEIVGRALVGGRRNRVVLATKCGLDWGADEKPYRNSAPERIRTEIENSLRRLQTDVIDIYQVHWPDSRTPFEETAGVLDVLLAQGKIRAVGVSNFSPEQMAEMRGFVPLHTNQPPYNLFERGIEHGVLPYCRQEAILTLTYGALCRGLLSGRMSAETTFGGDDLRRWDPKFRPPRFTQYLAAVERLDAFAQHRFDKRVVHLAVRWLLDRPGVGVALWGARRPEQLAPVEGVFGWHLDDDAMAEMDRIVTDCVPEPIGPELMAPPV